MGESLARRVIRVAKEEAISYLALVLMMSIIVAAVLSLRPVMEALEGPIIAILMVIAIFAWAFMMLVNAYPVLILVFLLALIAAILLVRRMGYL